MGWSTTVVAAIWLTCLALLFQAVGFAIPFWISVVAKSPTDTTKEFGTYIGVWYVMSCVKGESDSCHSQGIEPKFTSDLDISALKIEGDTQDIVVSTTALLLGYYIWWQIIQIVTTIGIGMTLVATLILICCRCAGIHSKGLFILSCLLLFFGGLINMIIAVLTGIGLSIVFSFVEGGATAETFPWSVLLFGIGGFLAFVASIVLMVITCSWRNHGMYNESVKDNFDEPEVPMSNISRSRDRGHDNPRYAADVPRNASQYDRYPRDNSSSNKYRDTSSRDHGYKEYQEYDRKYDQGNTYDRPYDRTYDQGYTKPNSSYYAQPSRQQPSNNMYRPYAQSQTPYKY